LTAATSREYLEGIIGIVAVVMMLSVGAWLHKRTNVKVWDQYVKDHIGTAIAKGSLFSMSILSFLAIFREGGETIIFFAGMAPSMKMSQLILGIGLAFLLLILLGFVIIRYSAVIPLRPFFIFATALIYVLSFKMLGVSIHSLQVASVLPIHSLPQVPYIEFIGLYPAWETLIPQLSLLLVIVGAILHYRKNVPKQPVTLSK
jgi:high-affinity iron transporter